MYNTLLIARHPIETLKLSGKPEELEKEREEIRDGWAGLKKFHGLSKISMNEDGEALRDYFILVVRHGQWVRATRRFIPVRPKR